MPINAFRLQNFMAFRDTDWIELRRINLLLGKNSSGKTAIIRALRLMRQSLLDEDESHSLKFKVEGGVDIGSFETSLHKSANPAKQVAQITFGFRGWISTRSFSGEEVKWAVMRRSLPIVTNRNIEAFQFEVNLGYEQNTTTKQVQLTEFRLDVTHGGRFSPFFSLQFDPVSSSFRGQASTFSIEETQAIFRFRSNTHFLPDLQVTEFADGLDESSQERTVGLSLFWEACKKEIDTFLKSIQHIGPIRPQPERSYAVTDEMERKWRLQGWEFFANYLRTALDEEPDDTLNYWISRLGLGEAIKPIPHFRGNDDLPSVTELVLYEGGSNNDRVKRNVKDMGYGASQIVPIIIAALRSDSSALVLIEQPELHLHPAAQVELADLFIHRVINDSNGESPIRFLIETHSEHLVLRALRRIRNTTENKIEPAAEPLEPEQLHVFSISRSHSGSELSRFTITEDGDFEEKWPGGFFEERRKELFR